MLDFDKEMYQKVTFVVYDKVIYALTPTPVGENCRKGGRFWSRQQHDKALNMDPAQNWTHECQELLGKSPRKTGVVHESVSSALLVSVYFTELVSDEKNHVLLYARPISRLYMRELKVRDQNYIAIGAGSDVIGFTNPDWDFGRTESQMHEELMKFHDPATSTFLHCKGIDPSQRWCIG